MLVDVIEPDFKFLNESGSLVQLVHDGWKQVNVIKSNKGSKRGGHFHKQNKEAFYIIKGKVILTIDYENKHEEDEFGTGDMFVISQYQMHNFFFREDTIMVSMYSNGVELEDGTKDIYIEE